MNRDMEAAWAEVQKQRAEFVAATPARIARFIDDQLDERDCNDPDERKAVHEWAQNYFRTEALARLDVLMLKLRLRFSQST